MHSLRHTYASVLIKQSVPITTVSAMLGPDRRGDHYAHLCPHASRPGGRSSRRVRRLEVEEFQAVRDSTKGKQGAFRRKQRRSRMEPKITDLDRTEPNGTGILPVRFPLALPSSQSFTKETGAHGSTRQGIMWLICLGTKLVPRCWCGARGNR